MPIRMKDLKRSNQLSGLLDAFSGAHYALAGLTSAEHKDVLIAQLVDSIRRIEYLRVTSVRARSASLYTPFSGSFQPLAGAAALDKAGHADEAYWLVYLATHFGKHKTDGWNLTEDFYGRLGQGGIWDWAAVSQDPQAVSWWLQTNYPHATSAGRSRRFGNHRKFETLKPGPKGTGHAVETYVQWINSYGSHRAMIAHIQGRVGQNPKDVFACVYRELNNVAKLGRLGKFDLLCNLSNLQIAPIIPDIAYIAQSTGPKDGAKLLFGNGLSISELETACAEFANFLNVSPQVIEDALCNWQKSPARYIYFRG